MKISKRSLHYRFLNRVSSYTPPRDLCTYMRNLVGWMFIYGVLAVTIPTVVFGMAADVGVLIIGVESFSDLISKYNIGFYGQTFLGVAMGLGVLAWLIAGVALVCLIVSKIKSRRRYPYVSGKRYERTTLIAEWWRAHREKVCPIIEFTE